MGTPAPPLHGSVVTFGEPLVSFSPNESGHISRASHFRPYVGGAELNTAIGLARLGVRASYAGAVGDDPFGRMILERLRADGVNVEHVQVAREGSTGVYFKQRTGLRNETSVFYYRSRSAMARGLWRPDALKETLAPARIAWMHTSGITCMIGDASRSECHALLQRARRCGMITSFDANVRLKMGSVDAWRHQILQTLAYVDWFIIGHEEAQWLFATRDSARIEETVSAAGFHGAGVVLKRGAAGVETCRAGRVQRLPALAVSSVVDKVGAGDGFNAGWIAGMVSGWSLEDALRLGTVVGAFAVSSPGDCDGYPYLREALDEFEGGGGTAR